MNDASAYDREQRRSMDDLVRDYLPLVKKIALHWSARLPPVIELDDLMQVGLMGLIQASENYDSSQGASFATVPQLNDALAEQALSNAGIAQMGNLGNMLGTPVAIAILSTIGYQGLPVFLIVCYAAAIALHVLLARRRATNPAAT